MNRVILMGRLTRDPDIRWSQGQDQKCVARFTLAVDRRTTDADGSRQADFISCTAFGHTAEFAEKYLKQGTRVVVEGRIRTGSYTNREGNKAYTTDVWIDSCEFAESKSNAGQRQQNASQGQQYEAQMNDGFMTIPDGVEDEGLPFN